MRSNLPPSLIIHEWVVLEEIGRQHQTLLSEMKPSSANSLLLDERINARRGYTSLILSGAATCLPQTVSSP